MTKGNVCKAKRAISKAGKGAKHFITDSISNLKATIADNVDGNMKSIKRNRAKAANAFKRKKQQLKDIYLKQSWRQRRPDITLFIEVVFAIILGVILYYVWPMLTSTASTNYSPEQLSKAAKMSPNAFNMEEIAKVNMEARSFSDYAQYFKNDPFSPANMGIDALNAGAAVLPFVQFFIMFVLPPFTAGYIIWFIIRFYKYVYKALWGWFVAMYKYFTSMIQGKLGCKWYIRMVTGWGCNSPNFYQYYVQWRRQYVDVPAYYEKLNYIKKFHWAKRRYYELPMRHYITIPRKRYAIKAKFAKKLYVDRAIEVFLKKLSSRYPQYYTMPKKEFLKWLTGKNRYLAGVYSKAMQTRAQIGRPYRSITKSGKQCVCPGSKSHKELKKKTSAARMTIDRLVKATNKVYDKVTSVSHSPTCETVDKGLEKTIKNRHDIARKILIFIVCVVLSLYIYSSVYGTPIWLKNATSATTSYMMQGTNMVVNSRSIITLPLIYLVAFSSMMVAVLFT